MYRRATGLPKAVSGFTQLIETRTTRVQKPRRRPVLFVWAVIWAALLLLSSFGTERAYTQQSSGEQESVRTGGTPIRIGGSLSLTGTYEDPSSMMYDAYTLWAKQINEREGLLGSPVELIIEDDRSSPERAAEIYRELIEEEEVDLLLSPYGTPITLAAAEVTEEYGYVLMAAASAGEETWSRGYSRVFGMYAQGEHFFTGFLDLCARNGLNSVSILYERNTFNRDAANGAHLWAGRMGIGRIRLYGFDPQIVGPEDGQEDGQEGTLEKIWQQVEKGNSEALIVCSYPPSGYRILELLEESEYCPEALGMTITPIDPDFYKRAAEIGDVCLAKPESAAAETEAETEAGGGGGKTGNSLAEGVCAPSLWEPNERIPFPGTDRFIEAFEEHASKEPTYHAASAYSACRILEEAITLTRGVDHEALARYIFGLDTVTILGRFKVDHTGKQIGHNPMLVQWQEGRKEIVYPASVETAEPMF
ncbi:MAG: amino acid ABC transporter substrate-binding protein [Spirochaetaceae bacterium]